MNNEADESEGAPRRKFLEAGGALIAGGFAGLGPIAASVTMLLDPLRRPKRESGMVGSTHGRPSG